MSSPTSISERSAQPHTPAPDSPPSGEGSEAQTPPGSAGDPNPLAGRRTSAAQTSAFGRFFRNLRAGWHGFWGRKALEKGISLKITERKPAAVRRFQQALSQFHKASQQITAADDARMQLRRQANITEGLKAVTHLQTLALDKNGVELASDARANIVKTSMEILMSAGKDALESGILNNSALETNKAYKHFAKAAGMAVENWECLKGAFGGADFILHLCRRPAEAAENSKDGPAQARARALCITVANAFDAKVAHAFEANNATENHCKLSVLASRLYKLAVPLTDSSVGEMRECYNKAVHFAERSVIASGSDVLASGNKAVDLAKPSRDAAYLENLKKDFPRLVGNNIIRLRNISAPSEQQKTNVANFTTFFEILSEESKLDTQSLGQSDGIAETRRQRALAFRDLGLREKDRVEMAKEEGRAIESDLTTFAPAKAYAQRLFEKSVGEMQDAINHTTTKTAMPERRRTYALILSDAGKIARDNGDYENAYGYYASSGEEHRKNEDSRQIAAYIEAGRLARFADHTLAARVFYDTALSTAQTKQQEAQTKQQEAQQQAKTREAQEHAKAKAGYTDSMMTCEEGLGHIEWSEKNYDTAYGHYWAAGDLAEQNEDWPRAAALYGQAQEAANLGEATENESKARKKKEEMEAKQEG